MKIKITELHPDDAHYWDIEDIRKEELTLIGAVIKSVCNKGYFSILTNRYAFSSCKYERIIEYFKEEEKEI